MLHISHPATQPYANHGHELISIARHCSDLMAIICQARRLSSTTDATDWQVSSQSLSIGATEQVLL